MSPIRLFHCAAAVCLIALSGCGRRGATEPPPEAGVSARAAREQAAQHEGVQTDPIENNRRVRGVVPPKDPFVLDPLL